MSEQEQSVDDALSSMQAGIEALKAGDPVEAEEEKQEELFEVVDEAEEVEAAESGELEDEEPSDDIDETASESEGSIEEQALALGWTPYDEYTAGGGDPNMYRGAKAFMQFQEVKDKYRGQRDEEADKVKSLESKIDELSTLFIRTQQESQTRHKKELENALKEARDTMDVDAVQKISTDIAKLDGGKAEAETEAEPAPQMPAALMKLVSENPIIDKTSDQFDGDIVAAFGTRLDNRLAKLDGKPDEDRMAAIINQEWEAVTKKFAPKQPARIRKTAPNTATTRPTQAKAKPKAAKMNAEEKAFYELMKDTRPEYAKAYYKTIQERTS